MVTVLATATAIIATTRPVAILELIFGSAGVLVAGVFIRNLR
jgi:hypothetical protein